jgi:DNA-directed RNA polymerase subunit RPC12/RpoP
LKAFTIGENAKPELKVLAERLEELSFSPEQRAWLRDLLVCLGGERFSEDFPTKEAYELFLCASCGEQFFFLREAYGPEDTLLCPECGEVYSMPPKRGS